MKAEIIDVLVEALFAAELGDPPDADLLAALQNGDENYPTGELEFDSLQAMEFCISVEVSTGAPLSNAVVAQAKEFGALEKWIVENASEKFKAKLIG